MYDFEDREARLGDSNKDLLPGWLTTKVAEKLRIGLAVNKKGKTVSEGGRLKVVCNNTME
jgi:hypothetical protein